MDFPAYITRVYSVEYILKEQMFRRIQIKLLYQQHLHRFRETGRFNFIEINSA